MTIQFGVTHNFQETIRELTRYRTQVPFATAQALNDAGFKARGALQAEMDAKFDRPTPFIKRSLWVERATKDKLTLTLEPRYQGGKGTDPKNVLKAEIEGGTRKHKRSEVALRRVGILPPGYVIVPGETCQLDTYGNIPGSFLVRIISYFQAFSEQGYKANMTDKNRARLAKVGKSEGGFKRIGGVVYFVAYGRLRGGRTGHLAPGIWAKTGTHGVDVKPVLMFVRNPQYRARFDFHGVGGKAAEAEFVPAFERRYAAAVRTAR